MKLILSLIALLVCELCCSQDVNLKWAAGIGIYAGGSDIALDQQQNVISSGKFSVTSDFDPSENIFLLEIPNYNDWPYIAKYTNNGQFVWAKAVQGTGTIFPFACAADAEGNIYVTGRYQGTFDFDPGENMYELTSTVGNDVYIMKLDADGNFMWAGSVGGTTDEVYDLALDNEGNIFLTGYTKGTGDFDPGINELLLTATGTSQDVFVLKLDTNGNLLWAELMGGIYGFDEGHAIATDSQGNCYVTGTFGYEADFDPSEDSALVSDYGVDEDIFILKLDADGNYLWVKSLPAYGGTNVGKDILIDHDDNIIICGKFSNYGSQASNDPQFGLISIPNSPNLFVAKYDSSGNKIWAEGIAATNTFTSINLALGASNDIFLSGSFFQTVDFDPSPDSIFNMTAPGSLYKGNIYLEKLNTDGEFQWALNFGDAQGDSGNGIAIGYMDNIYITGVCGGEMDMDPSEDEYIITPLTNYTISIGNTILLARFAEGVPGDFNDDGIVNVDDLTIFMSQYGCVGESCSMYDLDSNGVVGAADLMWLIGLME